MMIRNSAHKLLPNYESAVFSRKKYAELRIGGIYSEKI